MQPSNKDEFPGNLDPRTVQSFGDEWGRFDQSALSDAEAQEIFGEYFRVFPWSTLPEGAEGFDMGCGSGRWARWVAPRVGHLHCIDPSTALEVARKQLERFSNVSFYRASVDDGVLPAGSQDFGYSLGVLHHIPDTEAAIRSCVQLLKPGAPLLLYLYYALDNRGPLFRLAWRCSDALRRVICSMQPAVKHAVTDIIAATIYLPLALLSRLLAAIGLSVSHIPLAYYRDHSFYTMRTDSRDRFGTPLERRFTKEEIERMMASAGLRNIRFSDAEPYWCAVGVKAARGSTHDQ